MWRTKCFFVATKAEIEGKCRKRKEVRDRGGLTCQRWINVTEVESMSEAERERKNCMQTVKAEAKTRSDQLRENLPLNSPCSHV